MDFLYEKYEIIGSKKGYDQIIHYAWFILLYNMSILLENQDTIEYTSTIPFSLAA